MGEGAKKGEKSTPHDGVTGSAPIWSGDLLKLPESHHIPGWRCLFCAVASTQFQPVSRANQNGLCIENLGNFDLGGDAMNGAKRSAIVTVNARLLMRFSLPCDIDHVIYHHWWDLNTGQRTNGGGSTDLALAQPSLLRQHLPPRRLCGQELVLCDYHYLDPAMNRMINVARQAKNASVPLTLAMACARRPLWRLHPDQSAPSSRCTSSGTDCVEITTAFKFIAIRDMVRFWANFSKSPLPEWALH